MKTPVYSTRSTNVIAALPAKLSKLRATYDAEPVSSLTVTKLALWNAGQSTIDRGDIPEGDKIRIRVDPAYKILDGTPIAQVKPESNKFATRRSSAVNELVVDFEYMDRGQGVAIELLHTARSGDSVTVIGSVKGGKSPVRFEETSTAKFVPMAPLVALAVAALVIWALVAFAPRLQGYWPSFEALVILILVIAGFAWTSKIAKEWQGIPKDLRVIESKL